MQNVHVIERLAGIQNSLIALHQASSTLSSASKGTEREQFVGSFLAEVFPPPFRFGTGDITDATGNKSGQVDVVVEYPFLPSLPTAKGSPRLYLAEGVAAAIEVKSDLAAQWEEVERTSEALKSLTREFGTMFSMGESPGKQIPLFAVGYAGWRKMESLVKHLESGLVDGILVIDSGLFASADQFMSLKATGPWSLWGLISCLHRAASNLKSTSANPMQYALRQGPDQAPKANSERGAGGWPR